LPIQVGSESLGRSIRRMQGGGERAGPERYWCGAMQAAKRPGLTERSMVSANQAGFNLRETDPLPRTILHSWAIDARAATGQRTRPRLLGKAKGYRGGPVMRAGTAVAAGYLTDPVAVRDTAKSGRGCQGLTATYTPHRVHLGERGRLTRGG